MTRRSCLQHKVKCHERTLHSMFYRIVLNSFLCFLPHGLTSWAVGSHCGHFFSQLALSPKAKA